MKKGMAKRNILKFSAAPVDYTVIGISSHENDYRISWSINKQFDLHFSKKESLKTKSGKDFSCFIHQDDEQTLMLVSNICDDGFLLEKYKNFDFILKFDTQLSETKTNEWLYDLRKTPLISAAYIIPTNKQILIALG